MYNVKLHFINFLKSKKTIVTLLLTILLLVVVVIASQINCDIQINIHEAEYNKLGDNLPCSIISYTKKADTTVLPHCL